LKDGASVAPPKRSISRFAEEATVEELGGKVAVITGAGSGIGAALARACAAAGMAVAVVDVVDERAARTAATIAELGGQVVSFAVDVSDPDDVEALAARVFEQFGACHLLCNNAGICPLGVAWSHPPAEWQRTVGVNVLGVVNGVNAFVPPLIAQGQEAHIVNTASAAALRYVPASALYNATKHAVLGFSESLRPELAPFSIGVSVLCPGGVATNISETAAGTAGTAGAVGTVRTAAEVAAAVEDLVTHVEAAHATTIPPQQVAELVLEGVRNNDFYIVTHPGSHPAILDRAAAIDAAYLKQRRRHPELP
jgi:NAD(P)-dependent dehydrogenase (short-subunit alcohol dehydrogenase family)